jgi:hypothetical protein
VADDLDRGAAGDIGKGQLIAGTFLIMKKHHDDADISSVVERINAALHASNIEAICEVRRLVQEGRLSAVCFDRFAENFHEFFAPELKRLRSAIKHRLAIWL